MINMRTMREQHDDVEHEARVLVRFESCAHIERNNARVQHANNRESIVSTSSIVFRYSSYHDRYSFSQF